MRADGQHEIFVLGGFARAVDHARAGDEIARRDRVDGIVGPVAPGDPVDRRVEMGAGVLAAAEIVPVPLAPAARVVAGYLFDPERRALPELRRQDQGGKIRRERLRQIDDANALAGDGLGEVGEIAHGTDPANVKLGRR